MILPRCKWVCSHATTKQIHQHIKTSHSSYLESPLFSTMLSIFFLLYSASVPLHYPIKERRPQEIVLQPEALGPWHWPIPGPVCARKVCWQCHYLSELFPSVPCSSPFVKIYTYRYNVFISFRLQLFNLTHFYWIIPYMDWGRDANLRDISLQLNVIEVLSMHFSFAMKTENH